MLRKHYLCPHFRILVIGRANAGKTTILSSIPERSVGRLPRSSVRRAEGGSRASAIYFWRRSSAVPFLGADRDVSVPPFPFLDRPRHRRRCAPPSSLCPPIAPLAIFGCAPLPFWLCPPCAPLHCGCAPPILPICDLFLVPIKCRLFFGCRL